MSEIDDSATGPDVTPELAAARRGDRAPITPDHIRIETDGAGHVHLYVNGIALRGRTVLIEAITKRITVDGGVRT